MLANREKIYVDTSAFYALLDRSDHNHKEASAAWPALIDDNVELITSNYVVSETVKQLQDRIGFEAAKIWHKDILGILNVLWVDAATHQHAYELWLNLGRMRLSLIDCVSFVTMHHHQIEKAFCFKPHFIDHGFSLLSGRGYSSI
jgi:predicted nucleic acid-binding protein